MASSAQITTLVARMMVQALRTKLPVRSHMWNQMPLRVGMR